MDIIRKMIYFLKNKYLYESGGIKKVIWDVVNYFSHESMFSKVRKIQSLTISSFPKRVISNKKFLKF